MTFTLNGAPIQHAKLTMHRHGLWTGDVTVAGPLTIAVGAAVELVLGDTTFSGSVVPAGGTFVDEASFAIVAGRGWSKVVKERSYSVAGGVRLADVATKLATDAGEQLDVTGADRALGDHWTRPAGPASLALWDLFPLERGGWRADPDGVARPGVRPPAPLPAGVELVVEDHKPEARWARVSLPGDQLSAVLPGAILTGPTLKTPLVVGETTIYASADSVTAELLGEGGALELFAALVMALTPSRTFNGVWTYQVGDDTGRPNLRALASTEGLPAQLQIDNVPGVAGVTSQLQPGALVLVGFRDGHPGRPYIAGYLGGVLPLSVAIDAVNEVRLGGAGAGVLAKGTASDLNFSALWTAVTTLGGSLPARLETKCTKARGE